MVNIKCSFGIHNWRKIDPDMDECTNCGKRRKISRAGIDSTPAFSRDTVEYGNKSNNREWMTTEEFKSWRISIPSQMRKCFLCNQHVSCIPSERVRDWWVCPTCEKYTEIRENKLRDRYEQEAIDERKMKERVVKSYEMNGEIVQ